jgi:hypothetical protein
MKTYLIDLSFGVLIIHISDSSEFIYFYLII